MIEHHSMSTMSMHLGNARGIVHGYEIRGLRGGDGTRPSTNQDLLDTGIVPSQGFLFAGVVFIPGNLIVR